MEKTLVLVVSHRGLYPDTEASLQQLKGATCIVAKGLANLAKARSMAFDSALARMKGTDFETVLSIDDDMVFKAPDVQRLIDLSRATGVPQSAVALKMDRGAAVVAARRRRLSVIEPPRPRWWTGLACMAIPRAELEALAKRLPVVGGIREWCQTGAHEAFPNEWCPEDFWFCEHFGGVELAAIPVGHTKPLDLLPEQFLAPAHAQGLERFTIWPDEETLTNVRLSVRQARADGRD